MTKIRMSSVETKPARSGIRPWLFNIGVVAFLAYAAYVFYLTPMLPVVLVQAVRASFGG